MSTLQQLPRVRNLSGPVRVSKQSVNPHDHVWEPSEVAVSKWVLAGAEPVRMVIHHDAGDWSVVCGTVDSADQLVGMPLSWLREQHGIRDFATTLRPGRMVTRDDPSEPWVEEDAPPDE